MIKRMTAAVFVLAAASIASAQTSPAPPVTTPGSSPSTTQAPAQQPKVPHTNLKVGQAAPDFTLPSTISGADGRGVRYKLSDFKGKKNVVLAFYVLAFTGG